MIPVLLLGLLLSNTVSAQQSLTLKEALNYAIQNSVNVRKAKLDIDGGRYKTEEIRGQALPQITGNASFTDNLIIQSIVLPGEIIGKPGETLIAKAGTKYNTGAGIQLSQQLFNQTVFTGLKAAKTSEQYYSLYANLSEEQVIEQVASNYYAVLVNKQQLDVINTNIKNVKVVEQITVNQHKNGLAKKIDVDRIKVKVTNLETQKSQVLNTITQLENQLKFSMGMPVETAIVLPATELAEVKSLPDMSTGINLDNRTELKIANIQKDLYTLDRKAKVSEYFPTLALNSNYNYTGVGNKFDMIKGNSTTNWYDMAAVGLTLKVPIFNGFTTRAKVRQADVNLKKAEEDIKQTKNSLNLAYENAKIGLKDNMNTIISQRQNVLLAQEIYNSTQNNYNNGLATLTDLLETEDSLTEAQKNYNQALLNYKVAEIQLIKSNGNIKSLL
ncbi:MAG: TolC family protein [Candidatus Pedobacter colombiensis]|uniref:TolC family protein n=1 Tax=Candidatus Pedobacter colombiensis TaxID=3121371 RepID=A0AAJ6B5I5_9SPHI|nr:TolC family protein [Pedobacter sp.]WEK18797.1 MAG: TolC family protein [Pedobacter sp.]